MTKEGVWALAGIIIFISVLSGLSLFAIAMNNKYYREAPCSEWRTATLNRIPVRCLKYYNLAK